MLNSRQNSLRKTSLDWWSIAIYAALVFIGWLNIYSAVYTENQDGIFDLSQRYGMQMIWIGFSICISIVILLIDEKFFHMFAYPLYWIGILVLVGVLFFGREVNGAKAWLFIGKNAIQPAEFVKLTTSLAIARYMSRFSFSIQRPSDFIKLCLYIMLPVAIIMLQNDTGTAVVFAAFFLAFYREGLNGWVYIATAMAIILFLASFLLTPITILISLIIVCVLVEAIGNGHWRTKVMYLSLLSLLTLIIYFGASLLLEGKISFYSSLIISVVLSIPAVIIYAYRHRLKNVYFYLSLFVASLVFTATVDYVFDNILQLHQQKRILDLLGLESDTQNWGYNVNQSKIAIGSGGFSGKGFLEGTQTRFDFVPEQSTDFIFCTVGEEWGFLGTATVVALFCFFILRLMAMGERQREPFGRIYCYCVAAIFFVHVVINIGMTIGIMPVIGIPLPFFSYGGSSFLAFSILFFIAVKFDASKRELLRH